MQADLLLGNAAQNSGRKNELQSLWNDGVALRTALNGISSKKSIQKVSENYAEVSAIFGDLNATGPNTLVGAFALCLAAGAARIRI
jgi:hypothetical protein